MSQLQAVYKELLRSDVQLLKHTAELEEFEHSSKQDRAKALAGSEFSLAYPLAVELVDLFFFQSVIVRIDMLCFTHSFLQATLSC